MDHHKGSPVGAEDPEGLLAIALAGLQVHHLVCTEMQQLLCGHLAQRGGRPLSGVDHFLARFAHWTSDDEHPRSMGTCPMTGKSC